MISEVKDGRTIIKLEEGDALFAARDAKGDVIPLWKIGQDEVNKIMAFAKTKDEIYAWVDQYPMEHLNLAGENIPYHWKVHIGAGHTGPYHSGNLRMLTWVAGVDSVADSPINGYRRALKFNAMINEVKDTIGKQERDLKSVKGDLNKAQSELKTANDTISKAEAIQEKLASDLSEAHAALQASIAAGAKDPDAAVVAKLAELQGQLDSSKRMAVDLQSELATTKAELHDLRKKAASWPGSGADPKRIADLEGKVSTLTAANKALTANNKMLTGKVARLENFTPAPQTDESKSMMSEIAAELATIHDTLRAHDSTLADLAEEMSEKFMNVLNVGGENLVAQVYLAWSATARAKTPIIAKLDLVGGFSNVMPSTTFAPGTAPDMLARAGAWLGNSFVARIRASATSIWGGKDGDFRQAVANFRIACKTTSKDSFADWEREAMSASQPQSPGGGGADPKPSRSWSILAWATSAYTAASRAFSSFKAPDDAGLPRKAAQGAAAGVGVFAVTVARVIADPFAWLFTGESVSSRAARAPAPST